MDKQLTRYNWSYVRLRARKKEHVASNADMVFCVSIHNDKIILISRKDYMNDKWVELLP